MLISLYRTTIKTKIWYLKVLFHCVDIANTIRCRSMGRSSRSSTNEVPATRKRKLPTAILVDDVRYDKIDHWPEFRVKKNKCRHCKTGTGRVYCKKCDVCLCLSNARNCFYEFHQG